ncbi:unnamed protein product [Meganyctiphanes norvegica]|uniref:Uncharacterized protein n=1 Tax=Meganyctiphanes norvegica TaxID=48144 RepID=A0AAV2Q9F6_MEGNR
MSPKQKITLDLDDLDNDNSEESCPSKCQSFMISALPHVLSSLCLGLIVCIVLLYVEKSDLQTQLEKTYEQHTAAHNEIIKIQEEKDNINLELGKTYAHKGLKEKEVEIAEHDKAATLKKYKTVATQRDDLKDKLTMCLETSGGHLTKISSLLFASCFIIFLKCR